MSANTYEAKIAEKRVFTQPYDFSVQDLVNKIKDKEILLQPKYQRNYVWDASDEKTNIKSRLIESLLLNIPIPVIYFAETAETLQYEVIDGQQRLTTFEDFLNDDFALKNLEVRSDVNGKKYSELSQRDKDSIRKRSIRAIVILNNSDEEVKYAVFERLNMGSIELTPQELRNNIFRGDFNELLRELATNKKFNDVFKFHLMADETNMSREELVLRFFAYEEDGVKRASDLKFFLSQYMKKATQEPHDIAKEKNKTRKELFNSTISMVVKFLGDKAFSSIRADGTPNPNSKRIIYEMAMLAFVNLAEEDIKITPEEAKKLIKPILNLEDDEGISGLRGNSKIGSKECVKAVEKIRSILTGTAYVG